ncbi:MAG: aspartate--tRNA ligase [Chlamydiia bacterium]|nr:aspartate--tRNA ligase [Chlamydiia bacterium]
MFDDTRTHNCGELTKEKIGDTVTLSGWVHRRRDHGGLIFIDLRDRYGITQLVFKPTINKQAHAAAYTLRAEWVISIKGRVIPREEGMINSNLKTGAIEIEVEALTILSESKTPPFSICDEQISAYEEIRLKYRYLDIRRGKLANHLVMRHKVMMTTRNTLDARGFLEISTPVLGKATPEGARDFLVPSRLNPGTFYALPQSPQLFKQLLMIGGMDRYFQIATCFRDEDRRADRQPEFTQIDIEISFCSRDLFFSIVEELVCNIFKSGIAVNFHRPFRRLPYKEAMERYGTDKPDLRFGMELIRLDAVAEKSEFAVFKDVLKSGGVIKGIVVKGGGDISRRTIDDYAEFVGSFGINGLAWIKMQEGGPSSSIVKFFPKPCLNELVETMKAETGDLILMVASSESLVNQSLDHLRRKIGKERKLIKLNHYEVAWITDFPLFQWDPESENYVCEHHPFTSPLPEDISLLDSNPLAVRSSSYDLVINGYECGSGSQRIHDGALQNKIFEMLKLAPEEIKNRFGFFIEALGFGTPPHRGIALGLDRLVMILVNTESIKDVIAFPKTQKASDLMLEAPSPVLQEQLHELKIHIQKKETL